MKTTANTHYHYPDAVIMLFCKAPLAGQVKTRLMPALTAQQAADLHSELSLNTLDLAVNSRVAQVELWCAPDVKHPFFSTLSTRYNIALHPQVGADLGARMHHAFGSALQRYRHALLMGCDCPSLTAADLQQAVNALLSDDVVLAPAEDGGYTLIGLNQPYDELFQAITWGSHQVLQQTRAAIKRVKLRHQELSQQWDIDTPADLARYRQLKVRLTHGD